MNGLLGVPVGALAAIPRGIELVPVLLLRMRAGSARVKIWK